MRKKKKKKPLSSAANIAIGSRFHVLQSCKDSEVVGSWNVLLKRNHKSSLPDPVGSKGNFVTSATVAPVSNAQDHWW